MPRVRTLAGLTALLLGFAAVVGTASSAASSSKAPYVIGADTSLTGPLAFLGSPLRAGEAAYYKYVNAHGGINGHPVKFIALDDQSGDTTTALTAARQLIEQDHALALTGWILTNVESAIQPYAVREDVPMIARGCDSTIATPKNKVVYCADPAEAQEATPEVQFAATKVNKKKPVKVAVLNINSVAQIQLQRKIVSESQAKGWKVVVKQLVATDTTDMSAQASDVQKSGATIAIVSLDTERIQLFDQALRGLGVKIPIVNFDGGADEPTLASLKDPLLYSLSSTAMPTDTTPAVKQYVAAMKAEGSTPLQQPSEDGYVEGEVVGAALKKCGWPCSASKLNSTMQTLGTVNTNGLAVAPLKYTKSYFLGDTAGKFYAWNTAKKRPVAVSGLIPLQ
jgi:branched-chain amino acid transport system substrate-binding protein